MKRVFTALLALAILGGTALADMGYNYTDLYVGRWKDARVGGASLTILPEYVEEEGVDYLVLFPTTFKWKKSEWTMTAGYNEGTGCLEYVDGVKTQNGKKVWSDASGTIRVDGKGKLTWSDSREADAEKLSLERDWSPTPDADTLVAKLFLPVAGLERGSAGAVMKAAQVIVQVVKFAGDAELWNADGEALQQAVNDAWNDLSDDEKARFDEAFADGVSDPADEAFEDYDAVKSVFSDAGVSKDMAELLKSPQVKLSWDMLSSAALNIGNIDDGVYEQAEG